MANTPNINLVKPLGTDKALVSVINENSEKIDAFAGATNTSIAKTQDGYAIVVNGNNAPKAITAGQYLFIKNHSSLDAGGYHATANIANGAAITSSNVTADADGVVNGAFSALNGNITPSAYDTTGISYSGAYSAFSSGGYFTIGNLVVLNIIVTASESRTSTSKLFELPASVKPKHSIALTAMNVADDLAPQYSIVTNSGGVFIKNIVADKPYSIFGCWLK